MPWRRELLGLGDYETSFPDALIDPDFGSIKDYPTFYDDADLSSWASADSQSQFQNMYNPLDFVVRPTTTRSASDPQQLRSNACPHTYAPSQLNCSTRPACHLRRNPKIDTALPATVTTTLPILGIAPQGFGTAQHDFDWSTTLLSPTAVSEARETSPLEGSYKRLMKCQSSEDESAPIARKISKHQPTKTGASRPVRTPHKLVERRYRNNLKGHLDRLSMKLPLVRDNFPSYCLDVEDSERAVKLPSKAIVIAAAAQYIEQLENDKQDGVDFVKRLQLQVEGLQRMVRCDYCSIMRYLESTNIATKLSDRMVC